MTLYRWVGLAFSWLTMGAVSAGESLCGKDEVVAFNCSVGGKIVSLCVSQQPTVQQPSVFYRYGIDRANVELAYPAQDEVNSEFSHFVETAPKAGVAVVGFSRGKYTYSIFETRSARGFSGSGLIVSREGNRVSVKRCGAGSVESDYLYAHAAEFGGSSEKLEFISPETGN